MLGVAGRQARGHNLTSSDPVIFFVVLQLVQIYSDQGNGPETDHSNNYRKFFTENQNKKEKIPQLKYMHNTFNTIYETLVYEIALRTIIKFNNIIFVAHADIHM